MGFHCSVGKRNCTAVLTFFPPSLWWVYFLLFFIPLFPQSITRASHEILASPAIVQAHFTCLVALWTARHCQNVCNEIIPHQFGLFRVGILDKKDGSDWNFTSEVWVKKVKVLICPVLPGDRKSAAYSKVPRIFSFVLLVRAICKWRRGLNTGRMIATGRKPKYFEQIPS